MRIFSYILWSGWECEDFLYTLCIGLAERLRILFHSYTGLAERKNFTLHSLVCLSVRIFSGTLWSGWECQDFLLHQLLILVWLRAWAADGLRVRLFLALRFVWERKDIGLAESVWIFLSHRQAWLSVWGLDSRLRLRFILSLLGLAVSVTISFTLFGPAESVEFSSYTFWRDWQCEDWTAWEWDFFLHSLVWLRV